MINKIINKISTIKEKILFLESKSDFYWKIATIVYAFNWIADTYSFTYTPDMDVFPNTTYSPEIMANGFFFHFYVLIPGIVCFIQSILEAMTNFIAFIIEGVFHASKIQLLTFKVYTVTSILKLDFFSRKFKNECINLFTPTINREIRLLDLEYGVKLDPFWWVKSSKDLKDTESAIYKITKKTYGENAIWKKLSEVQLKEMLGETRFTYFNKKIKNIVVKEEPKKLKINLENSDITVIETSENDIDWDKVNAILERELVLAKDENSFLSRFERGEFKKNNKFKMLNYFEANSPYAKCGINIENALNIANSMKKVSSFNKRYIPLENSNFANSTNSFLKREYYSLLKQAVDIFVGFFKGTVFDFTIPASAEFRSIVELYSFVMFILMTIFFLLLSALVFAIIKGIVSFFLAIKNLKQLEHKKIYNSKGQYVCMMALYKQIWVDEKWQKIAKKYPSTRAVLVEIDTLVKWYRTTEYAKYLAGTGGEIYYVYFSNLEAFWTYWPVHVLVMISLPSFTLALALDESHKPQSWLKVLGNQWFWNYEYSNYSEHSDDNSIGVMYSNIVQGEDLKDVSLRLLEPDTIITIPVNQFTRFLITSNDVIHSWAVPSLGIKVDACPGRINTFTVLPTKAGVYYGQCSEICGVNHAFMPICIEVVA